MRLCKFTFTVIGASAASPTLVVKTENCLFIYIFIGASAASPTLVDKTKICLYIYLFIYIWYVRIPYIHPAPFVRDAIFPHCMLVHVTTVAQEKRLAGQKD